MPLIAAMVAAVQWQQQKRFQTRPTVALGPHVVLWPRLKVSPMADLDHIQYGEAGELSMAVADITAEGLYENFSRAHLRDPVTTVVEVNQQCR